MTVVLKSGDKEVSSLLCWCYLCSVIILPAWTWVFLQFIKTSSPGDGSVGP